MEEKSQLFPNHCHGVGARFLERLALGLLESLDYVKPSVVIQFGFSEEAQRTRDLKSSLRELSARADPMPQ